MMPDLFNGVPLDLFLFLMSICLMFFQGVPAVMKKVWLPEELDFVEFSSEGLNEKQKAYFDDVDEKMEPLGFSPVLTYSIKNLQGYNLSRTYLSATESILANSVLLTTADHISPINTFFLELITRFRDGTVVLTKNSETKTLFDRMPNRIIQDLPRVKDPGVLKSKHLDRWEGLRERGFFHYEKDQIIPKHKEYHRAFCRFQVERGLLSYDPQARVFRATAKIGFRGVFSVLNPFGSGFLVERFLVATVFGGVLPTFMVVNYGFIGKYLVDFHYMTPANLYLLTCWLTFVLGGVVVGAVLSRRVFVWGFLLGYVPLRILSLMGLVPFQAQFVIFSVVLSAVAEWVAETKHKRERKILA